MLLLQPFITKKPDEKKLDTETTKMLQEDSAGVLLNGVNHVYGRIRTREQLKWTHTDKIPEGIDKVINGIMEYEPETLVPDINDHILDVNNNGDDDISDDEEETTINKVARVSRTCLTDLDETG